MLSFTDLRERLGLTQPALTRLIQEGLPWHADEKRPRQKRFDPAAVRQWLVEHGRVKVDRDPLADQPIANTRAAAAAHFGVSIRTLSTWSLDPTFPGRAGGPGRRDGYFPLVEIAQWLEGKPGGLEAIQDGQQTERVRLTKARADKAEIEVAKLQGELGDFAQIARFFERTIHNAVAVLQQMPDRVDNLLPPELPAAVRAAIRQTIDRTVHDTRTTLAELLAGDTDPANDDDDHDD